MDCPVYVSSCMLPFEHNTALGRLDPPFDYIYVSPVPCCPPRVAGHNRVLSAIVEASRRSFGECLSLTATSATIRMVEPLQVWLQLRCAARELVCHCARLPMHACACICGRVQQWGGMEGGGRGVAPKHTSKSSAEGPSVCLWRHATRGAHVLIQLAQPTAPPGRQPAAPPGIQVQTDHHFVCGGANAELVSIVICNRNSA